MIDARGRRYFSNELVTAKLRETSVPFTELSLGHARSAAIYLVDQKSREAIVGVANQLPPLTKDLHPLLVNPASSPLASRAIAARGLPPHRAERLAFPENGYSIFPEAQPQEIREGTLRKARGFPHCAAASRVSNERPVLKMSLGRLAHPPVSVLFKTSQPFASF